MNTLPDHSYIYIHWPYMISTKSWITITGVVPRWALNLTVEELLLQCHPSLLGPRELILAPISYWGLRIPSPEDFFLAWKILTCPNYPLRTSSPFSRRLIDILSLLYPTKTAEVQGITGYLVNGTNFYDTMDPRLAQKHKQIHTYRSGSSHWAAYLTSD